MVLSLFNSLVVFLYPSCKSNNRSGREKKQRANEVRVREEEKKKKRSNVTFICLSHHSLVLPFPLVHMFALCCVTVTHLAFVCFHVHRQSDKFSVALVHF